MKFFPSFLLALILFSASSVFAQTPDWFLKLKQIKVFQSSRQDVERVFENPESVYSSSKDSNEKGWGETVRYKTPDGQLRVFYSTGRCSETANKDGWNLDKDVVVSIEFRPVNRVKLSEFNLDLRTFTREKVIDTDGWFYQSMELGVDFGLSDGKLADIEYSSTPDLRKFDCELLLKK